MRTTLYKPGMVYLVNFHVMYKLGVSTAMKYRMVEYRMVWRNALKKEHGVPAPEIVYMFPVQNMRERERLIQARWRQYRLDIILGTEYFDLPSTEVDWFCDQY